MLSSEIPVIFVINLKHRTDRLASIQRELDRMGLLDRMEVVEGTIRTAHGTGVAGIAQSHMRCVQLAKERGYKYAMILQDDAKMMVSAEEFSKELNRFLECSGDDPWFGLWFGSYYKAYIVSPPTGKNYCTPFEFHQDTATLLHERGYDTYIQYLQHCVEKYVETGGDRYNIDQLIMHLDEKDAVESSFVPLKKGIRILNKKLCDQATNLSDRVFRVMEGQRNMRLDD